MYTGQDLKSSKQIDWSENEYLSQESLKSKIIQ